MMMMKSSIYLFVFLFLFLVHIVVGHRDRVSETVNKITSKVKSHHRRHHRHHHKDSKDNQHAKKKYCNRIVKELCGSGHSLEKQACLFDNMEHIPEICAEPIKRHHPMLMCSPDALHFCKSYQGPSPRDKVAVFNCLADNIDHLDEECKLKIQSTAAFQCNSEQNEFCQSEKGPQLIDCLESLFDAKQLGKKCSRALSGVLEPSSDTAESVETSSDEQLGQEEEQDQEANYYGYSSEEFHRGIPWSLVIGGFAVASLFIVSILVMVRAYVKHRPNDSSLPFSSQDYEYVPPQPLEQPFMQEEERGRLQEDPEVLYRYGVKYVRA